MFNIQMSQDISANNKRIAKNTMYLYVRMLFIMAVQLYTSRLVLNALGVVDYGLYNVVGGVVTVFSFLNMAMVNATQRYIAFELGKGDKERLKIVFTTTIQIHIIISFIIVIFGETLGLWFLYEKMIIPIERLDAAFWVYQFSIVTMIVQVMSVPYNSAIIAHEKMSFFAIISILEATIKLLIVYLLFVCNFDKLVFYALLIALAQSFIRLIYSSYCHKHFEETSIVKVFDRNLLKEIGIFAGWNVVGGIAGTLSTVGLNLLLNVFFGPVVNAARAIAVQVESAIIQFASNFQLAVDPQLTKFYAKNNMKDFHSLLFSSSKLTYFLLLVLSLPVLLETETILKLWLIIVPEYTVSYVRLILCAVIIESVERPLITAANANGRIKEFQLIVGGLKMLILPIAYVFVKYGAGPVSVYLVYLVMFIVLFTARIIIVCPMIELPIKEYVVNVVGRCVVITILSICIPVLLFVFMNHSILSSVVTCMASVVSVLLVSFFVGLTKVERIVFVERIIVLYRKLVK